MATKQMPEEVLWVFEKYTEQTRTAAQAASEIAQYEPHMAEYERELAKLRAMHRDAGLVHTNATAHATRLHWLLEAACAKAGVPVPKSPEIPADTKADLGVIAVRCDRGQAPCDQCTDPNCGCPSHVGGSPRHDAPAAPARETEHPAEPQPQPHSALFGAREPKRIGLVTYVIQAIGLWLVPPVAGRHAGGAVHA